MVILWLYFSQGLGASPDLTGSATHALTTFSLLDLITSSVRRHDIKLERFLGEGFLRLIHFISAIAK